MALMSVVLQVLKLEEISHRVHIRVGKRYGFDVGVEV
jgi:hypothetical protein